MDRREPTLAARFRAGEEAAIREAHQRFGGAVATVARSMLSDPDLVSEVVQQTFVKAWRASASFDADRELAPWLYSIARRTTIDVLRREGRNRATAQLSGDEVAPTGASFERTWEILEIRQAIDDLPEAERAVVQLSHLNRLTHQEIADHLGIAIGTVKSRSARAHRRLAAALRHLDGMQADTAEAGGSPTANQGPERDVLHHRDPQERTQ